MAAEDGWVQRGAQAFCHHCSAETSDAKGRPCSSWLHNPISSRPRTRPAPVARAPATPHSDITNQIIGAAMAVHSRLGAGHKEAVYQTMFTDERWAALPLDVGTRQVIADGMVVRFERERCLSQVETWCSSQQAKQKPGFAWVPNLVSSDCGGDRAPPVPAPPSVGRDSPKAIR